MSYARDGDDDSGTSGIRGAMRCAYIQGKWRCPVADSVARQIVRRVPYRCRVVNGSWYCTTDRNTWQHPAFRARALQLAQQRVRPYIRQALHNTLADERFLSDDDTDE